MKKHPEPISTAVQPDTAVLVGVITEQQNEAMSKEYLDELAFLAETAGVVTKKIYTQKLRSPVTATYIGSGKIEEIKAYIVENEINIAIFDDELTPSQLRNLEKLLAIPILDRTLLILKIFAMRARTAYAKTQVELAQCQYMLPRLKRLWTHLERQRGGTGTRGGSGELQIESDRRIVLHRITLLKEQLKTIDKQMQSQRSHRDGMVRLALVGYTNVGKSTLMNLLSKSTVFAENKLFATLDTTVRKVVVENLPFLLSDTVGFIRKLPTQLIESFKSTLDEVREADVLVHVVDISHPNFEEQMQVVTDTLAEIGVGEKPTYLVFNKTDAYRCVEKAEDDLTPRTKANIPLQEYIDTWLAKKETPCIFISAKEKQNVAKLRNDLYKMVAEVQSGKYPFDNFLW
ncbi:GTPase HflX [Bacteroidia bacterium]|nr:GTPase HflX [Bacteroidia bacterium]